MEWICPAGIWTCLRLMTSLFLTIPPFQNGNVYPMPAPLGILEGGNLFSGLPACKQFLGYSMGRGKWRRETLVGWVQAQLSQRWSEG